MIDDLITALENLQDAKADYREAEKTCQDDRGCHFMRREEKAIEEASEELAIIFERVVSEIVFDLIKNKSL